MFLKRPHPLPSGTLLFTRYRLTECLGQSPFGITYKADDLERKDFCIIKELAPILTKRKYDGALEFPEMTPDLSYRLKQHFLQEAKQLQSLNIQGIVPIRSFFEENNTAYYVRDHLTNTVSLEYFIENEVDPDEKQLQQWLEPLSNLLLKLHTEKIFHFNIKPSNILCCFNPDSKDKMFLIDFGVSQSWFANLTDTGHLLYNPAYAPPELINSTPFLGPTTDIYGLCASFYALIKNHYDLRGKYLDNELDNPLDNVQAKKVEYSSSFVEALQSGLAEEYHQRPDHIRSFIEIFNSQFDLENEEKKLEYLDQKLLKLHRFKFQKRECPSCHGVLEKIRPLKPNICPVCHEGKIQLRKLNFRLCSNCKIGVLHLINNIAPLRYCPLCQTGHLCPKRGSFSFKKKSYACNQCL